MINIDGHESDDGGGRRRRRCRRCRRRRGGGGGDELEFPTIPRSKPAWEPSDS